MLLPQSIVIGVVAVVLFHLQVKLTLYQFPFVVGAAPVMLLQLAFTRGRETELQFCPVVTPPIALVY